MRMLGGVSSQTKEISEAEIKPDKIDEFFNFLRRNLNNILGASIEGSLQVSYEGSPGILIMGSYGATRYEILVVYTGKIQYRVTAWGPESENYVSQLSLQLERLVYLFAEGEGKGIIYFVFVPGKSLIPAKAESKTIRFVQKLLLGNMVFLFAISIMLSYVFFLMFGPFYTPLALVIAQIPLLFIAPWIVSAVMGDWRIDERHGNVFIVGVKIPLEKYHYILEKYFIPSKYLIKRRLYEGFQGDTIDPLFVKSLMSNYGLDPSEIEIEIKRYPLYDIIKEVAAKFKIRTPKIYLSNILIPNAAATGLYPLSSAVFITSGLLVKLDIDEIRAVIGHEFSHLKNRDVLLFFLLGTVEYFTRVYLVLTWLLYLPGPFSMFYLIVSLTAFFFLAKSIEARADIDSAEKLGLAGKLATALRKIGYTRIAMEKTLSGRLIAWLVWRPHPPTLFRIEVLEKIAAGKARYKSPWIASLKLCLKDFWHTLLSL